MTKYRIISKHRKFFENILKISYFGNFMFNAFPNLEILYLVNDFNELNFYFVDIELTPKEVKLSLSLRLLKVTPPSSSSFRKISAFPLSPPT